MAKAKERAAVAVLDLPVHYGDVSIGEDTCRVGISAERKNLSLHKADNSLCGRRLWGKIVARSSGGPDQDSLPGIDNDSEVTAVFDVKGFSVSKKFVRFGLTFALESVDVRTLSQFAKRFGRLVVTDTQDLPETSKAPAAEAEEGEDV